MTQPIISNKDLRSRNLCKVSGKANDSAQVRLKGLISRTLGFLSPFARKIDKQASSSKISCGTTLEGNPLDKASFINNFAIPRIRTNSAFGLFWEKISSYGWLNVLQVLPPLWFIDVVYLIYCCFASSKKFVDKEDANLIENFLLSSGTKGYDGIDTVLRLMKDVLAEQGKISPDLIENLEKAIEFNQLYKLMGSCDEFLNKLAKKIKESSEQKPVFLLTGQYRGQEFFNTAITLHASENKFFMSVSQLSANREINSRVNPDSRYEFDSLDDLLAVFKIMHHFNKPSTKTQELPQKKEGKHLFDDFDQMFKGFTNAKKKLEDNLAIKIPLNEEFSLLPESERSKYDDIWGAVCLKKNGKLDPAFQPSGKKSPSLDPLKNLLLWLENQSHSQEFNKPEILLGIFKKLVDAAIPNLAFFSNLEKVEMLKTLIKKLDKTKRTLGKVNSDDPTLKVLADLKAYVKKIESDTNHQISSVNKKQLDQALSEKVGQGKIEFQEVESKFAQTLTQPIKSDQTAPIAGQAKKAVSEFIVCAKKTEAGYADEIDLMTRLFRVTDDDKAYIEQLNKVTQLINLMVSQGAYAKALEMVNQVLYSVLDFDHPLYKKLTYADLDRLSKNLNDLTLYLFESKTRAEFGTLWSHEYVNLHNVNATMLRIKHLKAFKAHEIIFGEFEHSDDRTKYLNFVFDPSQIPAGISDRFLPLFKLKAYLKSLSDELKNGSEDTYLRRSLQEFCQVHELNIDTNKDEIIKRFLQELMGSFIACDEFRRVHNFDFTKIFDPTFHQTALTSFLEKRASKIRDARTAHSFDSKLELLPEIKALFDDGRARREYNVHVNLLSNFSSIEHMKADIDIASNGVGPESFYFQALIFCGFLFMEQPEKEAYFLDPEFNQILEYNATHASSSFVYAHYKSLISSVNQTFKDDGRFHEAQFDLFSQLSRKKSSESKFFKLPSSDIDLRRQSLLINALTDPLNSYAFQESFFSIAVKGVTDQVLLGFDHVRAFIRSLGYQGFKASEYLDAAKKLQEKRKFELKGLEKAFSTLQGRFEFDVKSLIDSKVNHRKSKEILPLGNLLPEGLGEYAENLETGELEKKPKFDGPNNARNKTLAISLVVDHLKGNKSIREFSCGVTKKHKLLGQETYADNRLGENLEVQRRRVNIENAGMYPISLQPINPEVLVGNFCDSDYDLALRINHKRTFQIGDEGAFLMAIADEIDQISSADHVLLQNLGLENRLSRNYAFMPADLMKQDIAATLTVLLGREILLKNKVVRDRLNSTIYRVPFIVELFQLNPESFKYTIDRLNEIRARAFSHRHFDVFAFVTDILTFLEEEAIKYQLQREFDWQICRKIQVKNGQLLELIDVEGLIKAELTSNSSSSKASLAVSLMKIYALKKANDPQFFSRLDEQTLLAILNSWILICDNPVKECHLLQIKASFEKTFLVEFVQHFSSSVERLKVLNDALKLFFNTTSDLSFDFSPHSFGVLEMKNREGQVTAQIDLTTAEVFSKDLIKPSSFIKLPAVVLQNLKTVKTLENLEKAEVACKFVGPTIFDYLYEFQISDYDFKVYFNTESEKTVFCIVYEGKEYAYRPLEIGDLKGFSACLNRDGIWVDVSNAHKAIAFLDDLDNLYQLTLNDKHQITRALTQDGKLEVALNGHADLEKFVAFSTSQDLLILLDVKTKKVAEFSLISNPKIKFVRVSDSEFAADWKEDGWVLSKNLDQVGQIFGKGFQEYVLPLHHIPSSKSEYLIFAHKARVGSIHDLQEIEFDKSLGQQQTLNPFLVSVSEKGKVVARRPAFLQLAYFAYLQADYDRALLWLNLACSQGKDESKFIQDDLNHVRRLKQNFLELPSSTLRSSFVVLKALLLTEDFESINRLPTENLSELELRQKAIDKILELNDLVHDKLKDAKTLSFAKKEGYYLNTKEEVVKEKLRKESFLSCLDGKRPQFVKTKLVQETKLKKKTFLPPKLQYGSTELDQAGFNRIPSVKDFFEKGVPKLVSTVSEQLCHSLHLRPGGPSERFLTNLFSSSLKMNFDALKLPLADLEECDGGSNYLILGDQDVHNFTKSISKYALPSLEFNSLREFYKAGYDLNRDNILLHFWTIWELVSLKQITESDLDSLDFSGQTRTEEDYVQNVDFAIGLLRSYQVQIESGLKTVPSPRYFLFFIEDFLSKVCALVNKSPLSRTLMAQKLEEAKGWFSPVIEAFNFKAVFRVISRIKDKPRHQAPVENSGLLDPLTHLAGLQGADSKKADLYEKKYKLEEFKKNLQTALRLNRISQKEHDEYLRVANQAFLVPNGDKGIYQLIHDFNRNGVPIVEMRYLHSIHDRVEALEKSDLVSRPLGFSELTLEQEDRFESNYRKYFDPISQEVVERKKAEASHIEIALRSAYSSQQTSQQDEYAAKLILQGLDKFSRKFSDSYDRQLGLKIDSISQLSQDISKRSSDLLGFEREDLMKIISLSRSVGDQLQIGVLAGELEVALCLESSLNLEVLKGEFLDTIYQFYEDGSFNLENYPEEVAELERLITRYLMNVTEYQQLEQAKALIVKIESNLKEMKKVDKQRGLSSIQKTLLKAQLSFENLELNDAILQKLSTSSNRHDFSLEGQVQSRSYLVFEAKNEIILRADQKKEIEAIENDEHALREFRMGLGKSTVLFPLLSKILNKKGFFTILVVSDELFEQTRDHMNNNDYFFSFNRNSSTNPLDLMHLYEQLLEVRTKKQSPIMTVSTLAALENKIVELYDQLSDVIEAEGSDSENIESFRTKLRWLKSIQSLFDHPQTRFVADEADSNFKISLEKNYAYDTPKPVSDIAFEAGKEIFQAICKEEFKDLLDLILQDQLSILKDDQIQGWMKKISLELFAHQPEFLESLLKEGHEYNADQFADYLAGISTSLPNFMKPFAELSSADTLSFKRVSCFRHFLTKTIYTVAKKRQQLDFGFTTLDLKTKGFEVVPRQAQRETANTKFGQEGEMIFYHFLAYTYQMIDLEVFRQAFADITTLEGLKDPWSTEWLGNLRPLVADCSLEGLVENYHAVLSEPKNALLRIELLEFFMRGEEAKIKIYKRQIIRNVQDPMNGRKVAGASGTVNPYSLLSEFSLISDEDAGKEVTAETLFQIVSSAQNGLSSKISTYEDLFLDVSQTIYSKDGSSCKAIIIQGSSLGHLNTLEMVSRLRDAAKAFKRSAREFIFIHPEERRPYIWREGRSIPDLFNKSLDYPTLDLENVLFLFAPSDTRGTDFKIPNGFGKLYLGPTTTENCLQQAAWRLRRLGKGQTIQIAIEKSFSSLLSNGEEPSLSDLLQYINKKTTDQDSFFNLKKLAQRSKAIVKEEIRKYLMTVDLRRESDVEFDIGTYDAIKNYLIDTKDFEGMIVSDYEPDLEKDIKGFVSSIFEKDLQALRKLELDPSFKDPMFERLENERKAILENFAYHGKFLPSSVPQTFLADQGTQAQIETQAELEVAQEMMQENEITSETELNLELEQEKTLDSKSLGKIVPRYKKSRFGGMSYFGFLRSESDFYYHARSDDLSAYDSLKGSKCSTTGYLFISTTGETMLVSSADVKCLDRSVGSYSPDSIYRIDSFNPEPQILVDGAHHSRVYDQEFVNRNIAMARLDLGFQTYSDSQIQEIREELIRRQIDPQRRAAFFEELKKRKIPKKVIDEIARKEEVSDKQSSTAAASFINKIHAYLNRKD